MTVNLSSHPEDLFAAHLQAANPNIPTIDKSDINIRRIRELTPDEWPTVRKIADHMMAGFPDAAYIEPNNWSSRDYAGFVVRKDLYFKGGDVEFHVLSDNNFNVFIDGVRSHSGEDYSKPLSKTIHVDEGIHEIVISSWDDVGGAGLAFAINDSGTVYLSDTTWPYAEYTGEHPVAFSGKTPETVAEVDLLIEPSEMYGDFSEFKYRRIPVEQLFGKIDKDAATKAVEVDYDLAELGMLTGSINNFNAIYDNWYRFSHGGNGVYPSNPDEVDTWQYNAENDYIISTSNTSTYVGFISDDFAEDYEFNTIVTSRNDDDDMACINLAAFKQGDVDDREHTLSVILARGGWLKTSSLVYNHYQPDQHEVMPIDPYQPPANPDNKYSRLPWTPAYGHVRAIREGSLLKIWAIVNELPESYKTDRDGTIKQLVEDAKRYKDSDYSALGYKYVEYDLKGTIFNRPARYGYGQRSQPATIFWNIQRPNENPACTPDLKAHFQRRYGVNVGDDGVTVASLGANQYKVTFDNVLYCGELTMIPKA